MLTLLKISLGLALLACAWVYIFRKNLVFRVNSWMRDNIFNDQVALFSGRRVAVLLMILGLVALFSGIKSVISVRAIPPNIAADMIAQSRIYFAHKEYLQVIARCKELVRSNPNSVEAWELLATSWSALDEKELARHAAENLLRLNPSNPLARDILSRKKETAKKTS